MLRNFLIENRKLNRNEAITYEKEIHIVVSSGSVGGGMPNTGANGPGPAGNGSSNSIESGAIRYELFVGNRTSSFDERQSACDPGNLPLCLRRAALRIHGRCNRLRATQNIHRRVSARRRRRLLRCSGAAVIWCAASPHGTWLRIATQPTAGSVELGTPKLLS